MLKEFNQTFLPKFSFILVRTVATTPFRILELGFPAIRSLIEIQILEDVGEKKNPHLLKNSHAFQSYVVH